MAEEKNQSFQFLWPGKEEAKKAAEKAVNKRLVLSDLQGLSSDGKNPGSDSDNIYIEGDNLDALRLMADGAEAFKSTFPIKVIYIDPPYNTGNDFVYKDNLSHSDWLNMIYPRLILAHKLLSEDGAIFISIDESEVEKLKLICSEIFGEDNFINTFMWLHGKGKKDSWSRTLQQYVLAFAKNKAKLLPWCEKKRCEYKFSNPDNDPKGEWFSGSLSFSEKRSNPKHKNYYSITSPSGKVWKRQWMVSEKEMQELLENGDISFGKAPGFDKVPRLKIRPDSEIEVIPANLLSDCSSTRAAENHIAELFGENVFSYPKPVELILHLLSFFKLDNSTVLDFFSGSGTTAEAVLKYNAENNSNARFILVQKPEKLCELSVSSSKEKGIVQNALSYLAERKLPENLCEIGKERIRLAVKKYFSENKNLDCGFRAYTIK